MCSIAVAGTGVHNLCKDETRSYRASGRALSRVTVGSLGCRWEWAFVRGQEQWLPGSMQGHSAMGIQRGQFFVFMAEGSGVTWFAWVQWFRGLGANDYDRACAFPEVRP